jgi:hypothetical protein
MFLHAERVKVPFRGNDWEAGVTVPERFRVLLVK